MCWGVGFPSPFCLLSQFALCNVETISHGEDCVDVLFVYCHSWDTWELHALLKQSWCPESVVVCSPVGGASDDIPQQPSVEHSMTAATDNAVKVAEQNRQAAAEALTDVKQQIGQKE